MLTQLTIEAIILAPFVAAVILRRQDFSSMGIMRHNFAASTAIGLLLGLINVMGSAFVGGLNLGLSGLYSLIAFTSVGFVEEAIFRGYVQLRFSSWLGGVRGWIAATILFTLWHIPQELLVKNVSNGTTLFLDLILIFIPGLLFGWIMKRTQSIIAPALWHTVIDWSGGL